MTNQPLTLVTAVFGGFESVWLPLRQPPDIDLILVTDANSGNSGWSREFVRSGDFLSPRLANRAQKMLHYRSLPREGISVYVDANVRPIESLAPLFEAFRQSDADLGMYRHYGRGTVQEEARACLHRNKVQNPRALTKELQAYSDAGFPDTEGMWEGSVIFKRHSSPKLGPAMEEWWELYSHFQTRDQFSLPFVIWKHGLAVFDLDDHGPGRDHYFVRLQHSQAGLRNRLARYLQARAPENAVWKNLHRLARSLAKT
jgi:hypothetical protein